MKTTIMLFYYILGLSYFGILNGNAQTAVASDGVCNHLVEQAQIATWYRKINTLRHSKQIDGHLGNVLDECLVSNFFPIYLKQKKEGQIDEEYMKMIKAAYGRLKGSGVKDVCIYFNKRQFDLLNQQGLVVTLGFSEDVVKDFDTFERHRNEYLDNLSK